jgi:hypothetical protein
MLAEKVAEVEAMKTTIASLESALAEKRRGRQARRRPPSRSTGSGRGTASPPKSRHKRRGWPTHPRGPPARRCRLYRCPSDLRPHRAPEEASHADREAVELARAKAYVRTADRGPGLAGRTEMATKFAEQSLAIPLRGCRVCWKMLNVSRVGGRLIGSSRRLNFNTLPFGERFPCVSSAARVL